MARSISSVSLKASLLAAIANDINSDASADASHAGGLNFSPATRLANGTSADQANRFWESLARTLTSGNSENLDVYDFSSLNIGAGAGNDALGQALVLAEIVALAVVSDAESEGNLVLGGEGSANAWSAIFNADDDGVLVIKPGGLFLLFAPTDPAYAVDNANYLLKAAASGGDVTYSVYILGRSA